MATINLDAHETEILRETLESVSSDLGYEISNTDAKEYRDKLKAKRALIQRVIGDLGGA